MPTPFPFTNKGIVQRHDPSRLAPGEYYQLENAWSQQEGALTGRTGHQSLTNGGLDDAIVSLSKLNLGGSDSDNPRYRGSGTKIYRGTPPYGGNTAVYSGLTAGARWSAQQYNAGTAGIPSLYIATQDAALRDNGSYLTLQKWGIDPPPIPVTATPNVPSIQYLTVPGGATQRFIASINSNGSGFKTVSAFSAGPGYVKITPTAGGTIHGVNGIYVGMILEITDGTAGNEQVIVLAVDSTAFYTVTSLTHAAVNVTLNWFKEDLTTVNGTSLFYYNGFTIDASFNGVPADGYNTDDNFHIALDSTDVTNVTQIEIRIVPNYSGAGGAATDYYSYKLVPAAVMSAAPVSPSPAWVEFNIPKGAFTKVGNAGSGVWTWKNINEIDIIATANATGAGQTVSNSSIYFIGGGGLNDTAAGTTPYDWLYVYRNPTTGAVGNPCVPMITNNLPANVTNGKATLTLTGTAQAATIANGIGEISGPGSISIFRRGGTFQDGFYRHIGYATNPGSGATVQFIDNASDASLNTADTLQFDNDPPVPSSLPTPLTAGILHFQASGGGGNTSTNTANTTARLILSGLPTSFTAATIASVITVGSTVTVGFGVTAEPALIQAVGYNGSNAYIEVFLQYSHNVTVTDASETIECDTILRGKCNLIGQDFDCIFLAGDTNNPATLYQSKVGRPESFPVVNLENNFAQQINVGSAANPINGITSIGPGELVCQNLDNISIVQVWAGQMQQPVKAPATRGLYSNWCWCFGDDRVWYLAYDGIYVWSGGESQKTSEAIDYMFKKQTVNGILPMDMKLAGLFSFSYAENCLFVAYVDTAGLYHRLRYETLYDRWSIDTIRNSSGSIFGITALFTEPDTGGLLVGVVDSNSLGLMWLCDFYSTTDGWTVVPTDGYRVFYTAWRYWPLGEFTADSQLGEVLLEMTNPSNSVSLELLYNYATSTTETMAIPVNNFPTRGRFIRTVNDGTAQVAYSIGLKLTGFSGDGTPVTFFTFAWREFKLEEVTTGPATDWQTFGHPYDKLVWDIPMQYDTGGQDVTVYLDTVNGIEGNTTNLAVATYHLTGGGRSNQVFIVPDQTIAKLLRLRPQFTNQLKQFKFWEWNPRFDKLPPDSINSTPWTDSGYGCPKVFRSLNIQVDTGGIPASVVLQIDGASVHTFSVTGTFQNRASVITLPSNLVGIEWRLVPTPGTGGKFQLYGVEPSYEKQPCPLTHFDSLMQIFGSEGYKIIWQIWLDYQSSAPVVWSIYRDNDQLFYQVTLPAQIKRGVQRFYLPPVNTPSGGTAAFNKSISYQFLMDSAATFQLYRDGTRVEFRNLAADQRGAFNQREIWELIPLAA